MFADLPPELPVDLPFACVQQAARDYHVPESVLYAIRQVEGGTVGEHTDNTNKTKDYGPMQVNDVWVKHFRSNYGITAEMIRDQPCVAVRASAYIVRYEINRTNDFWRGVGNYHSRTPKFHNRYLSKVLPAAYRYQRILEDFYYASQDGRGND